MYGSSVQAVVGMAAAADAAADAAAAVGDKNIAIVVLSTCSRFLDDEHMGLS